MKEPIITPTVVNRKYSWWIRLFPIVFFFSYLNFTLFLFAFGPWPWEVDNGTQLYIFLALAHSALLLGYLSVVSRPPSSYRANWDVKKLVIFSVIANFLLLIPTSAVRTGSSIPDIANGLNDPGLSYANSMDIRSGGSLVVEYLRIIVGPLTFLTMPLSVYYWRRLSTVVKWFAAICMIGVVVIFIAMGTNKAIADTVILIPWLLLAGHLSGNIYISGKRMIAIACSSIVAFALFLMFFTAGQSTRPGSGALYGYFPAAALSVDYDNFIIRYFRPWQQLELQLLMAT